MVCINVQVLHKVLLGMEAALPLNESLLIITILWYVFPDGVYYSQPFVHPIKREMFHIKCWRRTSKSHCIYGSIDASQYSNYREYIIDSRVNYRCHLSLTVQVSRRYRSVTM